MKVFGWTITVVLGALFALAGSLKLIGAPGAVREFALIGYGQWFRYVTGVLEVSGAVGMMVPRFRFWAALLIGAIMACATAINLWVLHVPYTAGVTTVLMALALVLAWLRRENALDLQRNRATPVAPEE